MAERKPAAKKKAAKKRAAKKPAAKKTAAKKPAAKRTRSTKAAAKPKPRAAPKPEPVKPQAETPEVVKPAPKPPPQPQAPKGAALPSLKTALGWIGMPVDGTDKNLGKLAGLHVDVEDGRPRWAVVRLGRLAGCTALPFDHVAEGGDRLFAAYEKDWVKEAPRFKPDAALTADQELELCAHWGIRMDKGRSSEVKGRKPDEISAVPAESS
jgi:hypothetical protein